MGKEVYALPIINGHEVKKALEFSLVGDVAKLKFYVIDEKDKEFVENTLGENKSLSVRFSNGHLAHGIFSHCEVKINRIHSAVDEITEIEYTIIKQG
jgi:hypothetical protein